MARGDELFAHQLDTINNSLENTKRPHLFRTDSELDVSGDFALQPDQKQSVDLYQSQNTHETHDNPRQIRTEEVYQVLPGGHVYLRLDTSDYRSTSGTTISMLPRMEMVSATRVPGSTSVRTCRLPYDGTLALSR